MSDSKPGILSSLSTNKIVWPLLALGLLLLFAAIFVPNFTSFEIVGDRMIFRPIDILSNGSCVMLLGLGMTLVIATGGVDLSVGAIMAIAAAVAAETINAGQPFPVALLAGLSVATLAGAWNGLLVAGFGVQPIVATLVLMVAGRGIAQLVTGGQIPNYTDPALVFVGQGTIAFIPFPVILVAIMFAFTWALTRRTALGLMIESVGDSPSASRYVGIPVRTVKWLAYIFSGFCAGLAGLVDSALIKSADANNAGLYMELDAIFAVVVGGTALVGGRFYLAGSIVGAILLQTLVTTIYAFDVPSHQIQLPKAMAILAVILLQSPRFRAAVSALFAKRSVA